MRLGACSLNATSSDPFQFAAASGLPAAGPAIWRNARRLASPCFGASSYVDHDVSAHFDSVRTSSVDTWTCTKRRPWRAQKRLTLSTLHPPRSKSRRIDARSSFVSYDASMAAPRSATSAASDELTTTVACPSTER